MNDGEWARRIEKGDEEAIRLFIRTYHPALCRFLTGLTRSADDAEDLAQQAFIKACLYAGAYEARSTIKTWLHKIAYREYTHWRRAKRLAVPLPEAVPAPGDEFDRTVDILVLDAALARLPEPQRAALLLFDWAGLALEEVAAMLGVPLGTAKSRIHHTRRRLRKLLTAGKEGMVMEEQAKYESASGAAERCANAVVEVRKAIDGWRRAVVENRPPDRSALEGARTAFAGALGEGPLSGDDVRTGVELYHYLLDDKLGAVALLDRYMAQSPAKEELMWARGERLNALAGLAEGRGHEAVGGLVDEHRSFCKWVETHLSPDRVLGVILNPGAAVCWREAGKGEEWFKRFDRAYGFVLADVLSRWERFVALRTAATAARVLKDPARHAGYLAAIYRLADEDADWERNGEVLVGGWCQELLFALDEGRADTVADVAARARDTLRESPQEGLDVRHRIGVAAGNLAATFFDAKAYVESIEFGRLSVSLAPYYEHTFLRLAAALWATGGKRDEVLGLLRRGAALRRCGGYDVRALAEFADVHSDAEFLAAQGE